MRRQPGMNSTHEGLHGQDQRPREFNRPPRPRISLCVTAIPGLSLVHVNRPSMPTPVVYETGLCLFAQGANRVSMGERSVVYNVANYLLASVDMPLLCHLIDASPDKPYLCCKIGFDAPLLAELLMTEGRTSPRTDLPILGVHPSDPDLIDAVCRFVRLLDRPETIGALASLVKREILNEDLSSNPDSSRACVPSCT